jgi:L-threonylcarbamoyladenylate synthase
VTTVTFKTDPDAPDPGAVAAAALALARGEVILFPTETVYGWAVRADAPEAIARLRAAKGRDGSKPFTVHLAVPTEGPLAALEARCGVLPPAARALVAAFLPGPITLVLDLPEGGDAGFRLCDHAVANAVLAAAGTPVLATSVNAAGEPPAVDGITAREVAASLAPGLTAVLLDGGPTRYRAPSTVVRCTTSGVVVLREGVVSLQKIERALEGTPPENSLQGLRAPR